MAYSYRRLQHWNRWLSEHFLGNSLLNSEQKMLSTMLAKHFGKHALLIGVPHQAILLTTTPQPMHTILSPWPHRDQKALYVEADFKELPIFSGSIDLVILPHTLEFVDNPRQLLAEACRIVKPEGLIVICGFNPISAWGAQKKLTKSPTKWSGGYIHPNTVKAWLRLVDFKMEQQSFLMYRPPMRHHGLYTKLAFLEQIGQKIFPFLGGVYILVARAKVIPLTPIKLQWKQQLSSIGITPTISTHMRRTIRSK